MLLTSLMARLRGAATLAGGVFRRADDEQDLDDELQFHIDKATERNIRRGMSPGEARRVARATFGGHARWAESTRDEHAVGYSTNSAAIFATASRHSDATPRSRSVPS